MFNGNKLHNLRRKKKINQKELAKLMNVHQTAISSYESGKSLPSIENLEFIADYFNVTTDYLLDRSSNTEITDLNLQAIINELNKLDPIERIDIYSLLLMFVKKFNQKTEPRSSE